MSKNSELITGLLKRYERINPGVRRTIPAISKLMDVIVETLSCVLIDGIDEQLMSTFNYDLDNKNGFLRTTEIASEGSVTKLIETFSRDGYWVNLSIVVEGFLLPGINSILNDFFLEEEIIGSSSRTPTQLFVDKFLIEAAAKDKILKKYPTYYISEDDRALKLFFPYSTYPTEHFHE